MTNEEKSSEYGGYSFDDLVNMILNRENVISDLEDDISYLNDELQEMRDESYNRSE